MADEDMRDDAAETARRERVELRRRLLEVDPSSAPRDVEAAAGCECGCHPRPGGDVHNGGLCPCQLSGHQRRELVDRVTQAWVAEQEEYAPVREARVRALVSEAAALEVEAVAESPGDPLVISGTVDGVDFTMRERWDGYTIASRRLVASPAVGGPDGDWVVLATGTSADLYPSGSVDLAHALRFIVAAVRTAIRRQTCTHPVRRSLRYCPRCGTALVDPALR